MTIQQSIPTPETPQLRLDFYTGYIIRTLFDGQAVSQHAVDPHDVASALTGAAISTPVLCGDEVFWSRQDGYEQIGIYVRPQRWQVQLQHQPDPLTIPLPGFLFVAITPNTGSLPARNDP